MKKKFLFLMTLLAVSLLALAEMTVYVYKKDGTKVPYVASTVDSIGFVNVHTITFNANGGTGSMDVVRVKEGESIALPANVFTYAKAEFAGWNTKTDGSGTTYADKATVKPTANMTLYAQWAIATTGTENGYEWVDLGLSSGTKWASRNIGATAVGDYGNYYSWGETQTKQSYTWSTYTLGTDSTSLTKYNFHSKQGVVDNRLRLELIDDAANANWGGKWRMPTRAEWQELLENCSWVWGSQPASNGFFINGYLVTGPSGNSIFLPASGYIQDKLVKQPGVDAYYATSEILRSYFPDEQVSFYISSSAKRLDTQYRQLGLPVRPVYDEKLSLEENTTLEADTVVVKNGDYYYAKLGLSSGTKWAITNVGASTAEEYGNYYAWGETGPKEVYNWSTYKWCNGSTTTQTKYCTSSSYGTVDNKTVLDLADDAANANWGGNWRMPTYEEQKELKNDCRWTWVTKCGVKGLKVTGPNGVAVFLPAAGYRYDWTLTQAGVVGGYWSSSLKSDSSNYAYTLGFLSSRVLLINGDNRYLGQSVRPVMAK